jgi:hypothetical protein
MKPANNLKLFSVLIVFMLAFSSITFAIDMNALNDFFAHRPDIPENISKWSGNTDKVWILREWVKITTERNEDYQTAQRILRGESVEPPSDNSGDNQTEPGLPSDGFGDPVDVDGYPRPANDNGWGIHWFPTESQSQEEVERFVKLIENLNIKWVLFLNPGTNMSANEFLVSRLVEKNIMPVMRLYYSTIYPPSEDELNQTRAMVSHYLNKGVFYFQIYNEPNLPCEWEGGQFPENSISKWADAFIPRAEAVLSAGGIPGIGGPAFGYIKVDGSYGNGSEYFRGMINEVVNRGKKDLLAQSVVVIHNYTTDSHPSDRSQTEKFWQFETYHNILGEYGLDIPMIGGEGGTRPEDVGGDMNRLAENVMACYDYMPEAPEYYMCFSHWLLTAPEGNEWLNHAMYKTDGSHLQGELINRMSAANPPVINAGSTPSAPSEPDEPPQETETPPADTALREYAPRDGETWFPRDGWYDSGDLREAFMKKYNATTMNDALITKMREQCPNVGDTGSVTFDCALGFYEIMEAMDLGGYTWSGDWEYPIPESAFDPWRNEGHKHMPAGREVGIKRVK